MRREFLAALFFRGRRLFFLFLVHLLASSLSVEFEPIVNARDVLGV
jgi:hypothetical protein